MSTTTEEKTYSIQKLLMIHESMKAKVLPITTHICKYTLLVLTHRVIKEGDPPCNCQDCVKEMSQKYSAVIAGQFAYRYYKAREEHKKKIRKKKRTVN